MTQFIQYLYEYENGKRTRNLGFMKIDKQMDKTVIQIYTKHLDEISGIQFRKEDGGRYYATWEEEGEQMPEEVSEYTPPNTVRFEKIQRQDLSRLPRREWHIANNSFLLHGFYNYHHLLYIEEGDEVWIGVPGIYHEKESAVAQTFGFGRFRRLTDMELELSEEERNTYEDFGYWCRKVNM